MNHHLPFIVLSMLIFSIFSAFGQPSFEWGLAAGSKNADEITGLSIDNQGNTYVTGAFEDSMDVVDGSTVEYVKSKGWKDIFLAKYSPTGDKIWAFGLGNVRWDRAWALTTDDLGNVYTGGVFGSDVDFDPSSGTTTLTSNTAGVWPDGYLAKYDTDGNLQWAKHLLTARDRQASQTATLLAITSMEIDIQGDLVIGGAFWDTVWLSPSVMIVSDGPLRDMFLAKYDTSGNLIWGKQMGGAADQQIQSLSTDDQGNIFTTGYFFGSPDFDPAGGGSTLNSMGLDDIFLAKYTSSGALDWVKGFGSPNGSNVTPEMGFGVGTDASGSVYFTGRLLGAVDFDPGSAMGNIMPTTSTAIFTAKFNAQGDYDWAFSLEGGGYHYGKAIHVFSNGDFYLGGEYGAGSPGFDLDPSAGMMQITSLGGSTDLFLAKYDTDMNFLNGWAIRGLQEAQMNGLAVNDKKIAVGGWFSGSMLFDQQSGDLRFSKGASDMFVLRYGEKPNGIADELPAGTLAVFPNPAKEYVYIRGSWEHPQPATLRCVNIHGQSVFTWQKENANGMNIQIPTDPFPAGFYFVELQLPTGKVIQKLRIN